MCSICSWTQIHEHIEHNDRLVIPLSWSGISLSLSLSLSLRLRLFLLLVSSIHTLIQVYSANREKRFICHRKQGDILWIYSYEISNNPTEIIRMKRQTIFSVVKGTNDILKCRLLKTLNSSVFSPVAYDTSL